MGMSKVIVPIIRSIGVILTDRGYAIVLPKVGTTKERWPQSLLAIQKAERLCDILNASAVGGSRAQWVVDVSDDVAMAARFI